MVLVKFLQTVKAFPTNFMSAILSANVIICKNFDLFLSKVKPESFPYIIIKSIESRNFSPVWYIIINSNSQLAIILYVLIPV